MRYRRVTYRYAVMVPHQEARPARDPWRAERVLMGLAQPRWRPAADVFETPTSIGIVVELPGVDQDELEVQLFDDALVIEGLRRLPPSQPGSVYYAAEIRQGPFRLDVILPRPFDPDGVDAVYERGLLRITLAKAPER